MLIAGIIKSTGLRFCGICTLEAVGLTINRQALEHLLMFQISKNTNQQ